MSNFSSMPPPMSTLAPIYVPPPPYATPMVPAGTPYTNSYFLQPQTQPGQNYHTAPAAFNVNPALPVYGYQLPLRGLPTGMTCPHCKADIVTRVKYEPGLMTHIAAAIICIIGCCCFVCLPYATDNLKDATHECPECGKCIGFYRR